MCIRDRHRPAPPASWYCPSCTSPRTACPRRRSRNPALRRPAAQAAGPAAMPAPAGLRIPPGWPPARSHSAAARRGPHSFASGSVSYTHLDVYKRQIFPVLIALGRTIQDSKAWSDFLVSLQALIENSSFAKIEYMRFPDHCLIYCKLLKVLSYRAREMCIRDRRTRADEIAARTHRHGIAVGRDAHKAVPVFGVAQLAGVDLMLDVYKRQAIRLLTFHHKNRVLNNIGNLFYDSVRHSRMFYFDFCYLGSVP